MRYSSKITSHETRGGTKMSLVDTFVEGKNYYPELGEYILRVKKVTNIYSQIYLEKGPITICLDIEEMESYVSFYVSHKSSSGIIYYCGLSNYSNIVGEKRNIFDFSNIPMGEIAFKQEIIKCIKGQKKLLNTEKYQDRFVSLIYHFIVGFLEQLSF